MYMGCTSSARAFLTTSTSQVGQLILPAYNTVLQPDIASEKADGRTQKLLAHLRLNVVRGFISQVIPHHNYTNVSWTDLKNSQQVVLHT